MKPISTLLMLGVIAAAVAHTADAQTSYVRYEQAGEISWAVGILRNQVVQGH